MEEKSITEIVVEAVEEFGDEMRKTENLTYAIRLRNGDNLDEAVYVGDTQNIVHRLMTHKKEGGAFKHDMKNAEVAEVIGIWSDKNEKEVFTEFVREGRENLYGGRRAHSVERENLCVFQYECCWVGKRFILIGGIVERRRCFCM